MTIDVNKNIDTYKDDFFRGLTLQQTAAAALTLVAAGGTFAFFTLGLHVPESIAIYPSLVPALPPAAAGFLKIQGMSLQDYIRSRRRVVGTPMYTYRPEYFAGIEEMPEDTNRKKEKRSAGKFVTLTEEEQKERIQRIDDLLEQGVKCSKTGDRLEAE